jgi:hypothetical protein
MLTIAAGAALAGAFLDAGYSPRAMATATGMLMLIPAAAWAVAMRPWQPELAVTAKAH